MNANKKKNFNDPALNKLMKAEKKQKEKLDREKKKKMQIIKDRIDFEKQAKKKIKITKILASTGQNIYDINKKKIIDFMISLKNINFEEAKKLINEQISKYETPITKNYKEIDITKDPNYLCTHVLKTGDKCTGIRHVGKFCVKHVKKTKKLYFEKKEDDIIKKFVDESESGIKEKGLVSKIVNELKTVGFERTAKQVKDRWEKLNKEDESEEDEEDEEASEEVEEYDGSIKIDTGDDIVINLGIYNIFINIVDYFDKDLFDKLITFIEGNKNRYKDLDILYYSFFEIKQNYLRLKELKNFKKNITPKSRDTPRLPLIRKKISLTDNDGDNYKSSVYANPPWIPYRVKNVYINSDDFAILSSVISSYDLNSDKIKEYKRTKHAESIKDSKNIGYDIDMIEKNLILDDAGNKWYKTNKRFFKFFDMISLFRKKQEGDILTLNIEGLFDDFDDGSEIKIKIGFFVDDENFIVQNENIFNQEIEYFKKQNGTKEQKIKNILREPLTKSTLEIGSKKLFKELKKITNLSQDNQYADSVIEQMAKCETVKDFADKLADLLVYIDPTVEKIGNKIFKKKLISGYYNPEILASLSPSEKLPEIFNDTTPAKFQDVVAGIINNCKDIFVKNFSIDIYNERYNKTNVGEINQVSGIICENSKKMEKFDSDEIVYFYVDETDKTYCFLIKDLLNQFRNNNFKIYIKNSFEPGDEVEFQMGENEQWINGKIVDTDYYKRCTIEYKNQEDETVIAKKIIKNYIRGYEGFFTEKFVENFMRLYGNLVFEKEQDKIEKDVSDVETQTKILQEEILVPNLLELIEQDINLITGENFKIVIEVEKPEEEEVVEEQEVYEEDEGSIIQKKTGLPKRITNEKLFKKWVEKQRKKNEKNFKNYSPKSNNNKCEDCNKKNGVVRTVGKKNKIINLCLDCMENKDNKSFY